MLTKQRIRETFVRWYCVFMVMSLLCGVFVGQSLVHANSALSNNPLLRQGLALYNEQKYQAAISRLQLVLKWKGSSEAHKLKALKYLGFIHIIMGNRNQAKAQFMKIMERKPDFKLDNAWDPPKFVRFFRVVRKEFLQNRRVQLNQSNPKEFPSNQPLRLRFGLQDNLKRMTKVVLYFRPDGVGMYTRRFVKDEKGVLGKLGIAKRPKSYQFVYVVPPSTRAKDGAFYFEYYIHVVGANNKLIATFGGPTKPFRIKRTVGLPGVGPVTGGPVTAKPYYKTWWFWTTIGLVVAGGAAAGITAGVLSSQKAETPATGGAIILIVKE